MNQKENSQNELTIKQETTNDKEKKKRKKTKKELLEELQNSNLSNDFIFGKVLEDKVICKRVLESIIGQVIKEPITSVIQKSLKHKFFSKGVRLDLLNETSNEIYEVEMQVGTYKNLPKRSRYYQAIVDLDILDKGENYEKLKKTFIIFVCTSDPFTSERPMYLFENICEKDKNRKLNDRNY